LGISNFIHNLESSALAIYSLFCYLINDQKQMTALREPPLKGSPAEWFMDELERVTNV